MRIGVIGTGTVGARVVRELATTAGVDVALLSGSARRRRELVEAFGPHVLDLDEAAAARPLDVVVLATADATQVQLAREHVGHGRDVVTTAASLESIHQLLELDAVAQEAGRTIVAGAAFDPGLSTVLAVHAAALFEQVLEIHTASIGWGGPTCEDDRRAALRAPGREWRDGDWNELRAGAAKELLWFPDPIGAHDCGAGGFGEPLLLHIAVPGVTRLVTRGALLPRRRPSWRTRRGGAEPFGAARVEVRRRTGGRTRAVIYGAMDRPAAATAVVASTVAIRLAAARSSAHVAGVVPVTAVDSPDVLLAEWQRRGVRACVFEGTAT